MTKHTRNMGPMLALALVGLLAAVEPARADDTNPRSRVRANDFIKTAERGKTILNAVHFGARYDGHKCLGYTTVKNAFGTVVPGHFSLVYDFKWAGTGETRLAFLCDARGSFYKVQVVKTNAVLSQPFAVAKLSIKVFGEAILKALEKDIKEADRKTLRKLIDNADPKGLLEASLVLKQTLGK